MNAIRKTIRTGRQIGRDDKGQMLVEMAITLPLVLFMFFAVLQYLFLVNVSLAGHYAAFIASRSYAVHESADHDDAIFYSKMAASMAYTPLSSPAPGESLYYATQTAFDPLAQIQSEINSGLSAIGVSVDLLGWFINLLPDSSGMDNVVNGIPKPVRAFIFAYLRMDLHKSEGSDGMEIMAPDDKYNLPQISMRLNYRLPLWLPGFAETWDLAGGDDVNSTFQSVWKQPAMMVQSVCTMGMEPWSGEVNDKTDNRREAKNSESDNANSKWRDEVSKW